jgi:DNA-binding NtrC family response regulator
LRIAHQVASANEPVLISGEPGTGKRELARLMHEWSGRAGEYVVLDCSLHPVKDIDAHLFATLARGGTFQISEIGNLSLADQLKLMSFIEAEEIPSTGSSDKSNSDIRIIATTSRDLKLEVELGNFHDDLFYRLEASKLVIPPLRERTADIAAIANHFLNQECATTGRKVSLAQDAYDALSRLPLEGNASELHSIIRHMIATASGVESLTAKDVETSLQAQTSQAGSAAPWPGCSLEQEVLVYEGELIKKALNTSGGSVTRAARLLGITHQGLAFILQGRHKSLLASRTPARPRRRSLMRPVDQKSKSRNQ